MGLSFTPLSHGSLSSVPEDASGEASGMGNATRELGGVFGIAIAGLIFQSGSDIRTPQEFVDHIVPSLASSAIMMTVALIGVALFVRNRRGTAKADVNATPKAPAQAAREGV
jgi:hypothetical protein